MVIYFIFVTVLVIVSNLTLTSLAETGLTAILKSQFMHTAAVIRFVSTLIDKNCLIVHFHRFHLCFLCPTLL